MFRSLSSLILASSIIVTLSSNCRRCVSADLHCYSVAITKTSLYSIPPHLLNRLQGGHQGNSYCSILPSDKYSLDPFLVLKFDSSLLTPNTILKFSTIVASIPILIIKIILIAPSSTDVSALCNTINKWTFADRSSKIILFQTIIDFIKFFLIHRNS